jgi:Tol biopolymer transport system component
MDELKLAETSEPINDMSWSPDARDVAYILNNASIYAASPERSISRLLYNSAGPVLGGLVSYSPSESGSTLMLLARKNAKDPSCSVAILEKQSKDESDAGSLRFLTESGVDDAIWSPDGSKIAYTQSGELWVMDALNGGHKVRLAASGIIQPCWSKK